MVFLSVVERWSFSDPSSDGTEAGVGERALVSVARCLGDPTLLRVGDVDGRSALRADVIALARPLRRVVVFPVDAQEFLVVDQ